MAQDTANLALPLMQAAQAQKHVTHNEALEVLDLVTQLTVQACDAVTPPASPVEGQIWALGSTPSGVWAGHGGGLAAFAGGGWVFVTPRPGWRAWDLTGSALRVWQGGVWVAATPAPALENLPGVGINASSDSTNRLAVASPAVLFNHAGAGHQVKINKAAATDTASLLYQTGYSGRAEMGLAGNDDFSIKVSANGSSFTEALRISASTGQVSMPASRTRQLIAYNYRHYLYEDRRWSAPSSNVASLNASQGLGSNAVPTTDWDSKGNFVPSGSLLRGFVLAGGISGAEIADMEIGLYFQHGPWSSGWTAPAGTIRSTLYTQTSTGISSTAGMCRIGIPLNFTTPADGYVFLTTRPSAGSTLTATRYFDCAGALDLSCPL